VHSQETPGHTPFLGVTIQIELEAGVQRGGVQLTLPGS